MSDKNAIIISENSQNGTDFEINRLTLKLDSFINLSKITKITQNGLFPHINHKLENLIFYFKNRVFSDKSENGNFNSKLNQIPDLIFNKIMAYLTY